MKFKVGDKVEVKTDDSFNNKSGSIVELPINYANQYGVLLDNDNGILKYFFESELELIGENKEEVKNVTNAELHKQILDEKHDIFVRKNQDYGNSFAEQFQEYGLLSAVIRLDDKLRRLKQLLKNEAQVKDESIRDTLVDLSNYADMTVMELDKQVK
jgi:hypothetical protein